MRSRMRLGLRAPTPGFRRVRRQVGALALVWLELVALTVGVGLLIGPVAILGAVAAVFTLLGPIAALALWGRSLDAELGWQERLRR